MNTKQIIQQFLSEAEEIKNKLIKQNNTSIWNSSYDELITKLKDISELANIDDQAAYSEYLSLKISKYNCFGDYIKNNNSKAEALKFNVRQQSIAKDLVCRQCASRYVVVKDGVYCCVQCGSEIKSKVNTQLVAKEITDNSKHITKQLNALTGRINPPSSISKILPFLETWLLNRKFLGDYLQWTNSMKKFNDQYKKITGTPVPDNFFEEVLEKKAENLPEYALYKLYTDWFFEMTEKAKHLNGLTSNMTKLNDELIIEICKNYVSKQLTEDADLGSFVPAIGTKFEYNNVEYEIGNYIGILQVSYYPNKFSSSQNVKSELRRELEIIFDSDLIMPGLMFNYKTEYSNKSNTPKKFTYQQNYIFIIHKVYNIESSDIIEEDKNTICDLMNKFNLFIKELKHSKTGKQHNSCLWQLTLSCVLTLPYFRCYKSIIDILPIKASNTSVAITEAWSNYCVINHNELVKFKTVIRNEIPKEKTEIKVENDVELDTNSVVDFISGTGRYYASSKDNYLRDKLNVKEIDHAWTNDFTMQDLEAIRYETIQSRMSNSMSTQNSEFKVNRSEIEDDDSEEDSYYDNEEESNYDDEEISQSDFSEDNY